MSLRPNRIEAENLASLYVVVRNPNKLAKNLRHLFAIGAPARRGAHPRLIPIFESLCGRFAPPSIPDSVPPALIENLLDLGGLCTVCRAHALRLRFPDEDRKLIAKAWPGETFRRFDGATLGMIKSEMDRARRTFGDQP